MIALSLRLRGFTQPMRTMNRSAPYRLLGLLTLLATLLLSATAPANAQADQAYRLGVGDEISITVFGESDLSMSALITDSGTISYPFLGEIRINGLTLKELESTLDRGLRGDYLVDPKISVSIRKYRQFYINGEVKSPGGYPFQPGLTVRKAVSIGGGFTERASKTKITLIREGDNRGEPRPAELDTPVFPGDIVTVDESFF